MPVTNKDGRLEEWANQAVAMEQNFEALYGAPATPPTLPPITNYDGMLEAIVDAADEMKQRLTDLSPIYHNKDSAYVKTVPANVMPYASIEKLDGKTVVWNQLMEYGDFADISNWTAPTGASISNNVLSFTATTTTYATVRIDSNSRYVPLIAGHKYYISAVISCSSGKGIIVPSGVVSFGSYSFTDATSPKRESFILTPASSTAVYMSVRYNVTTSGTSETITGSISNYMCVDLTLLFGSGNEPSTVAEFESMFPASYYAYNNGTLLSADVQEVKSVGKNIWDEEWKVIGNHVSSKNPIAVLPNTQYYFVAPQSPANGIKFYTLNMVQTGTTRYNRGLFTTPADCYYLTFEMGDSTYGAVYHNDISLNKGDDNHYYPYMSDTYSIPSSIKSLAGYGWSAGSVYNYIDFERKVFVQNVGSRSYTAGDESDDTVITDKTTTYYPLNPAVETDISSYITDNTIEVESGGTLTFPNSHGSDYRIDVPSDILYEVDAS